MKFLVGHSGILVALFTCDDCIETFILMSWLILSFNTVLASPIRTGYPHIIRAGVLCYHFDALPLVVCCAFYLDLLHQLFQGEVYLQLCGTPYGLFTKGAMAGSWVLLHPANTRFAECVPAVRKNNWLQHQCITKRHREHEFRLVWVFARESKEFTWANQRTQRKKENTEIWENATNSWIGLVLNRVGWDDGVHFIYDNCKANLDPKQSQIPDYFWNLIEKFLKNLPLPVRGLGEWLELMAS